MQRLQNQFLYRLHEPCQHLFVPFKLPILRDKFKQAFYARVMVNQSGGFYHQDTSSFEDEVKRAKKSKDEFALELLKLKRTGLNQKSCTNSSCGTSPL